MDDIKAGIRESARVHIEMDAKPRESMDEKNDPCSKTGP